MRAASQRATSGIWLTLTCVAGGGERVAGRRAGQPEGLLELEPPRVGSEARAGHADARGAALAVRDERDLAEARRDGRHRVLDVRDEGAATDLRTVDVARPDAQVLGGLRAHPEAGAEDGVDLVLREPRIGERVGRREGKAPGPAVHHREGVEPAAPGDAPPLEVGAETARAGGARVEDVRAARAAALQRELVPPRRLPEGTRLGRGDGERSAVLG